MIIKECFKNDLAIIEEVISDLPRENCIMNYSRYLEKSSTSEIEMQYIKILNKRKFTFAFDLIKDLYSHYTKEQLLEILLDVTRNGYSGFEDQVYDDSIGDSLRDYFLDKDIHQNICNEMFNAYEELVKELSATKKEAERTKALQQIQMHENAIKTNEKYIQESKEKIEELRKKIDE